MATRNISLTAQQDAFVAKLVKSGEYQNASEAMRDALRALKARRSEEALKLKRLRVAIKVGIDQLDRGEFVEMELDEVDGFMQSLVTGSLRSRRPR
jgi:antitoxin ParD1/3/4